MRPSIDDINTEWLGYSWGMARNMKPLLVRIKQHRRASLDFTHRWPETWVVDYYLTPGLDVTVHGPEECRVLRKANSAHLYPPNMAYHEICPSGRSMHNVYFHVAGGEAADMGRFVTNRYGFARFDDARGLLRDRMLNLSRMAHIYGEDGFWRAQSLLLEIIDVLHMATPVGEGQYELKQDQRIPEVDPIVVGVRAYLQAHVSEPVTLAAMARTLGVSPSTLSHRYKEAVGEAPIKTLMRMRIRQVETLLMQGVGLKQIARQAGFGSESHLCNAFKAQRGMTPKSFVATNAGSPG